MTFEEFRQWFITEERQRQPRVLIDMTIEKLGELCGDPHGNAPTAGAAVEGADAPTDTE